MAGLHDTGRHTVKAGETLAGIASRNGTSVGALVSANGIANPNRIYVGQVLVIPDGSAAPRGGGTASYTIQRGDTLAKIAARHGTTVAAIVAANGITNANHIVIGRSLVIPGGGGAAAASSEATGGHLVKSGETLAGIAARYGMTSEALAAANGIVGDRIYAGTRLLLTSPGSFAPAASGAGSHTVKSGETLGKIAAKYGTTISAIAEANGISNPNLVRLGAVLAIPGGGAGFVCPVPGARFINDWGFARSGKRWHEGNDLMAPGGTPVLAPTAGNVVYVTGALAGLEFKLTADDGTLFLGSHLSAAGASGRVAAGDVIGYVGDSGNARGGPTHLHFEIHPNGGAAVNPYPTVSAAC